MRLFVVFCCIFVVVPPVFTLSTDLIKRAVQQHHKRLQHHDVKRTAVDDFLAEIEAFRITDLNSDGHITASEWATFYTSIDADELPKLSFNTWKVVFIRQMNETGFDKNRNGMMELNEYLSI